MSEWQDLGQVKGSDGVEGDSVDYIIDGDRVGFKNRKDTTGDYEYTEHLTGPQGEGLEFTTNEDKIGIKKESEENYTYVQVGNHVVDHTEIRVVDSLPETGESNIIYLRRKDSTGELTGDIYSPIYFKLNDLEETEEEE